MIVTRMMESMKCEDDGNDNDDYDYEGDGEMMN